MGLLELLYCKGIDGSNLFSILLLCSLNTEEVVGERSGFVGERTLPFNLNL